VESATRRGWIDKGEKNTKYFLGLEKARANAKIMEEVKDEHGNLITKQDNIMKVQRDYFINLYKKKISHQGINAKINNFLDDAYVPKLHEEQAQTCEGRISRKEALQALKQMKDGSAPGSDGLTTEFFKVFWSRLQHILVASFNASFEDGKMSTSQRNAIITLIHKGKHLPRNELKNWRPISLTNVDYKLLAKCLAIRVSTVIKDIINCDQVGFIKGRRS